MKGAKRIPIRIKLMLWYGLLTGVLLAVFLPILFGTLTASLVSNQEIHLRSGMSEAVAAVELENGRLSWNEEQQISENMLTVVASADGGILYRNTNLPWMSGEPFSGGNVRVIKTADGSWSFLDQPIQNEGKILAWIRVCISREPFEKSVADLRMLVLLGAPFFFLLAVVGGYFIARQSMKPVVNITKTAKSIQGGDLSHRIVGIESEDEVGELAATFNDMLEHLELSFNREKRFSSDASHELRTPVSILTAYSESLLEHEASLDEEAREAAYEIYKEARRMRRIISQLLALTRGYEGRYKLELESVDLGDIAESVREQMKDTAEQMGITLSVLRSGGVCTMLGDQSLLTQMLLNLVENAIKYGRPQGFVRITICTEGAMLMLSVADDGIGIAADEQALVFERFYRADKARDRSGTGLGLSIVQWIVREHQGEITLESAPNHGTTFIIRLPIKQS